jgi:hypothetical protein
MQLSAIIKASGTDPHKEAHITLYMQETKRQLVGRIFEDILNDVDDDNEKIAYGELHGDWIRLFDDETDRMPRIGIAKSRSEIRYAGDNLELIAVETSTSYDYNYFIVEAFNVNHGQPFNLPIYEH